MPIATIDPMSGETVQVFDPLTDDELERRLARAAAAFNAYRITSFDERAGWLRAAADVLETDCDDIARVMTLEMGKTYAAAQAEVRKCAAASRYFAEAAPRALADETIDGDAVGASRAFVRYEPLGPVLAVMPWNFPLWQVMRFAAPALMAGNVGLLKHASNVPQCALLLEDVMRRAGFPDDVFQTLLIENETVEQVLRDPRVRAATLTGSTAAGRAVGAVAGSEIKVTVLELGGSDAFVVMPSADLDEAARVGVIARTQNNGQSCIAAKRFIVHDDVANEFERRFVDRLEALRVGDPMDPATDVGPLASASGRDGVDALVREAVELGARVLCGGTLPERAGWFYPPTAVTDITDEMRIFNEEVFGPVASIFRVHDLDAAIELANATEFGLGSNVWTEDPDEQDRFTRESEAGAVFVNGMTTSYPELPFGGVKASGYGRELAAPGVRSFCNVKSVWVR